MAEENNKPWKVYIIPDLRTWAMPHEYDRPTPIEYYDTFAEAQKRFNELREKPYNAEKALNWDKMPSARLTMGIERGNAAADIFHVRDNKNVLVEDFTRSSSIYESKEVLAIISQAAKEIGFEMVNHYPQKSDGKFGEPVLMPFETWAADHSQYNLTGGTTMEHKTSFDVSSISKIENGGNVKAIANVVVNGELAVRGVQALNNAVLKSYEQLMSSPEKTLKTEVPAAEQSRSSVNVQLRPVDNNNLKAAGQVTIDGCFVVKDVKVMTGSENKPFVSMPSYQTQTGDYAQYALPITKDFHEKLSNAVLRSYQSLGKTEYKGVKYAELGDKDSIAHLPKQNNKFAEKLMTELDKAGVKYQAKVEGTTTISVNKADMPKVTDIKNQLVKTLNPEKQTNSAPKYKR